MKSTSLRLLATAGLAAVTKASSSPDNIAVSLDSGAECACTKLGARFNGSSVLFANSMGYTDETRAYWDKRAVMYPRCIFLPQTADEIATAMATISACDAQFAIRGGGHMNVSHTPIALQSILNIIYRTRGRTTSRKAYCSQ